jgi:hypothetical protein
VSAIIDALKAFFQGDKPGRIAWVVDARVHETVHPRRMGSCLHLRLKMQSGGGSAPVVVLGEVFSFSGDN